MRKKESKINPKNWEKKYLKKAKIDKIKIRKKRETRKLKLCSVEILLKPTDFEQEKEKSRHKLTLSEIKHGI